MEKSNDSWKRSKSNNLTRDEQITILEHIARTAHATARIQAIRVLQAMQAEAERDPESAFDRLDKVTDLSGLRRHKANGTG